MNTNRLTRNIVVIALFVVFSVLMSACSAHDVLMKASAAAYDNDAPANAQTLSNNPRVAKCDTSAQANMSIAINAETNKETGQVDGYTIGTWLDEKDATWSCIMSMDELNNN